MRNRGLGFHRNRGETSSSDGPYAVPRTACYSISKYRGESRFPRPPCKILQIEPTTTFQMNEASFTLPNIPAPRISRNTLYRVRSVGCLIYGGCVFPTLSINKISVHSNSLIPHATSVDTHSKSFVLLCHSSIVLIALLRVTRRKGTEPCEKVREIMQSEEEATRGNRVIVS